jgi:membrane protein
MPQTKQPSVRAPGELPARRWRGVLRRVWEETEHDHTDVVAGGVAFYGFLALFPALAAVISIYGLVADPAQVEGQIMDVAKAMPAASRGLLQSQLHELTSHSGGVLGVGVVVSLLLALWTASRGMSALMTAVGIAYDTEDRRSFIKRTAITLALTLGGIVVVVVAAGAVIVVPAVLGHVRLSGVAEPLINWLRWPAVAVGLMLALAILYRYAPDRPRPRWQWVTWGSAGAVVLWLASSILFSIYVGRFGSYQKTYGSLAAVAILLLWLYVSAYAVILGAQLNRELESHAAPPEPFEGRAAQRPGPRGRPLPA